MERRCVAKQQKIHLPATNDNIFFAVNIVGKSGSIHLLQIENQNSNILATKPHFTHFEGGIKPILETEGM